MRTGFNKHKVHIKLKQTLFVWCPFELNLAKVWLEFVLMVWNSSPGQPFQRTLHTQNVYKHNPWVKNKKNFEVYNGVFIVKESHK